MYTMKTKYLPYQFGIGGTGATIDDKVGISNYQNTICWHIASC